MICSRCKNSISKNETFCKKCGQYLKNFCRGCDSHNDSRTTFCKHCGKPLPEAKLTSKRHQLLRIVNFVLFPLGLADALIALMLFSLVLPFILAIISGFLVALFGSVGRYLGTLFLITNFALIPVLIIYYVYRWSHGWKRTYKIHNRLEQLIDRINFEY